MRVEVWTDIVCPWCYVGEKRLRDAIQRVGRPVEVVHRSFELDPAAPRGSPERTVAMLARKYRTSPEQARAMEARVLGVASAEGLPFVPDRPVANTRDAHRLLHWAAGHGRREELLAALYRSNFAEALPVDDMEVLAAAAASAGLDLAAAQKVLASKDFEADVLADQARARILGARGVPFVVIEGRFGISGAQPAEALMDAFARAEEATGQD